MFHTVPLFHTATHSPPSRNSTFPPVLFFIHPPNLQGKVWNWGTHVIQTVVHTAVPGFRRQCGTYQAFARQFLVRSFRVFFGIRRKCDKLAELDRRRAWHTPRRRPSLAHAAPPPQSPPTNAPLPPSPTLAAAADGPLIADLVADRVRRPVAWTHILDQSIYVAG